MIHVCKHDWLYPIFSIANTMEEYTPKQSAGKYSLVLHVSCTTYILYRSI